jgi:hypothetical protein
MNALLHIIRPYFANLEYRLETAFWGKKSFYSPNTPVLLMDSRIPHYCCDQNASRILIQKIMKVNKYDEFVNILLGKKLTEFKDEIAIIIEHAPPLDKALAAAEVLGLDISSLHKETFINLKEFALQEIYVG